MRLRERARLSAALTRCALIRFRCKPGPDLSKPVGLRQWQQPKRFAPCRAVRVANPPSSCNPQSNELLLPFAGKPRGTGGLVPVVGQRPARDLRQSRRARSFLGNIRAILRLRGQGKYVRTSMDDTLSRQGRDGAGAPIWCYAGTRTRAMMLHEVEERAISSTYCGRRRV